MTKKNLPTRAAFTLVEAIVAISLVGVGITSAVAALTKFNAFASSSRNSTGAFAAVMNEIGAIEAAAPFNPQKINDKTGLPEIPAELALGTHAPKTVRVYLYKDPVNPATEIRVVDGQLTTKIDDVSAGGVLLYRATVTVEYTYLNRKNSFSMTTLRTSDQ